MLLFPSTICFLNLVFISDIIYLFIFVYFLFFFLALSFGDPIYIYIYIYICFFFFPGLDVELVLSRVDVLMDLTNTTFFFLIDFSFFFSVCLFYGW